VLVAVRSIAHNHYHPQSPRRTDPGQPGAGLRACLDEACANAGLRPRIGFEAGDPRVAAQLAAKGLGVAVAPRTVADAPHQHHHILTITRPEIRGRLAIAWRTEGPISTAAHALTSYTRTALLAHPAAHAAADAVR